MVPPGGFHFVEKHDGVEVRIESHSVVAVAEALLRYRLNNGLPPGSPKDEVNQYICGNWPHFCREQDGHSLKEGKPQSFETHLSRRLSVWMTRLWNSGPNNEVKQSEADRRAAICVACPQNVDFRPGGCGSCVEGVDNLSFVWLRSRKTSLDEKLHGCKACAQNNRCAVQASRLPALSAEEHARLDLACWRKHETPQPPLQA